MTDNTIALRSIGYTRVRPGEPLQVISVDAATDASVTVEGTADCPDNQVTCTLTRPGWSQTLFVVATDGRWSATFGGKDAGALKPDIYELTCCAEGEGGVCVQLRVGTGSARLGVFSRNISITSQQGNPTVAVGGTVTNPGNSVCLSLKRTDGTGTPKMKSVTATGNDWSWDFGAQSPGTYSCTAMAALEGTTGTTITVH
jgi:hypothetical protein